MKRIGVAIVALGLVAHASAHFVWGEFRPEGGRRFSLTFSEAPGQDVLPIMGRLAPKVQILGEKPGMAKTEGNSVSYPITKPTSAMLAYIPYGVVDRGGQVYGLDYYAKAVLVPADAARPVGKGFEIVATLKANAWHVSALLDGKPCPDAQVVTGADDKEVRGAMGGELEIPITAEGTMAVRATREFAKAGKVDGKAFSKSKAWTSLVLPAVPLVTAGSDPDAYRALEFASETREAVREGSAPWTVDFAATNGTDKLAGNATWDGQAAAKITFPGEENSYTKHVRGQLASLFMHRISRGFGEGDGKSVITWTDDVNELGRKMIVADRFNSSYRIKDGRIRQVVRTIGKGILTLDILEIQETEGGKYLTTGFRSVERGVADGKVHNELMYRDEFKLQNGDWLPSKRRLQGKADGSDIVMEVSFGSYRLFNSSVKMKTESSYR